MDKRKALELLKQALIEIPKLRKLHYSNQDFKQWQARVGTIIKEGLAADDYEGLDFVQAKYFPDELEIDHLSLEEDYLPKLNDYETTLKSILQKYEMLRIEGERGKGGEVEKMEKQKTIIDEMDAFRTSLIGFAVRRKKIIEGQKLTSEEYKQLALLFDEISIDAGKYGPLIKEITGLDTIHTSAGPQDVWNWALRPSSNSIVINALDDCVSATSRTIGTLKKDINNSLRDQWTGLLITPQTKITTERPKAFIAHEGETKALGKLKTFLDALGVNYLIAEIEASNGRLVEPQVTRTYENADFAIILATKGKVIDKQEKNVHYMGMNVADELGRAREVFKNRIILLLETGVQPHTNIGGIVYERFKPQSMDNAFIKIVKELRNWGFIRAGKVKEQI